MSKALDRRGAVKAAAAVGGLVLLGSSAAAQQPNDLSTLTGEWFNDGRQDQPCGIIQLGRVLFLINEKGDIATAQFSGPNRFTVIRGWGDSGLIGRVGDQGRTIAWRGGGNWRR
jgi:hypothetical protein